jgi:general secretion pathway protein D
MIRYRRLISFAPLLLAALAAPHASHAQSDRTGETTGAPAALTDIKLLAENQAQTVFSLSFAPQTAAYAPVSADLARPTLRLSRTRRTDSAITPRELKGLVRSIDFEQTEGGLLMRFNAGLPAKLVIARSGNRQLLVTVARIEGAQAVFAAQDKRFNETDQRGAQPVPRALEPVPGEDGYEMVMLKYADVSEVVGLLSDGITVRSNNNFIRREPGYGSPGSGNNSYTAAPTQQAQDDLPLGQSVDSSLAIDRRLNAIWIKGSAARIARIKAQIALIDVPVDSVILETQFVELTESGARNVGIDFTNANGQVAVGTLQRGQYVPFGFDPERNLPSLNLQAAIYAQVQKGEGRILSKPRIAAQSGSTAKIITGDALPILTAITLSGVNGVSQQVQYVNVGVTLQIAPRVSPDGFVTSHIYGVVSSVTGFSQGYPTISQREAETSASVRDGETFVIGGLTQENVLTTRSRIPLLGDIPLVGQAFRMEKTNRSKTELYIVITPHIVRHARFADQQPTPPPAPGENESTAP